MAGADKPMQDMIEAVAPKKRGRVKDPTTDGRLPPEARERFAALVARLRGVMERKLGREPDEVDRDVLIHASEELAFVALFDAKTLVGWQADAEEVEHINRRRVVARRYLRMLDLDEAFADWLGGAS